MVKTYPSLEKIKELSESGDYLKAPVCCEFLSDICTPIEALRTLKSNSEHCYILESISDNETWGRYTFLGYDPKMDISCIDGVIDVDGKTFECNNPSDYLRDILKKYKSPKVEGLPPFTGGLVGYFSYDFLAYSEPTIKVDVEDNEHFKDFDLMLFEKVIAFDNFKQKLIIISNLDLNGNIDEEYKKATDDILSTFNLLRNNKSSESYPGHLKGEITPYFDKERYCNMVEKAKNYIREGDIFQIVLSNCLSAPYEGSLFNTYRVLRTLNPSPYMFYFSGTDVEVAGASPETLVKLENGVLHTFPLAGTRPRGKTKEEDIALEKELLADEKELAEHNMLVDLGRNDLGKISKFGTVEVEKYHVIERYSHVMHIGSTVRGEIRDDKDALDAVSSVLPAGTLSGAPKIRACQLIGELENNKRGIYGGAIGYIDFTGNLDTCIAIRIAYKKNNKVFIRSGAGIVADSVPEKEYTECINKAAAVVNALKRTEEDEL